jgi:acetolactate synthase-1/2/3 large subunit
VTSALWRKTKGPVETSSTSDALAKFFGVMAMKAGSPEVLRSKLAAAFQANEPVVIEVIIPRGPDSSPWPFIHPAPLRQ